MVNKRTVLVSLVSVSIAILSIFSTLTSNQEIIASGTEMDVDNLRCVDTSNGPRFGMNIRGTVYNPNNGNRIGGATVTFTANDFTRSGTTASNGKFDIGNAPAGWVEKTLNISVTKSGYKYVGEESFLCSPIVKCQDDPDGCPADSVGGIIELPDIGVLPTEITEPDDRNYTPYIVAGIVLGIIITFTVTQYIRRRSLH